MPGSWIKMRAALIDHPKVIAISHHLQGNQEFREWLTPGGGGPMNGQVVSDGALRRVTTGALLKVWSVAREHGEFVGDDLVLRHSSLADLDEMGGVPGIGAAMASVNWANANEGGIGVTLCNFKTYNVPMTGAERQERLRKRRSEQSQTVTQTLRNSNGDSVTKTLESRVEKNKKKPATGEPPMEETDVMQVLAKRGVGEPVRTQLACNGQLTIQLIDSLQGTGGILVTRIRESLVTLGKETNSRVAREAVQDQEHAARQAAEQKVITERARVAGILDRHTDVQREAAADACIKAEQRGSTVEIWKEHRLKAETLRMAVARRLDPKAFEDQQSQEGSEPSLQFRR